MTRPEFIMLVGLPGSGKSYLAKEYADKGFVIHSSDEIRREISGDVNRQDINAEVFKVLHNRVKDDLKCGRSCVYDATNISYKRRKAFLQELSSIECTKICILIATPYEVCLDQNRLRERNVPDNVIERMYKNFDVPYWYEGWDDILLHYGKDTYKTAYGPWHQFIYDTLSFNQDNKHHKTTLGEHCRLCLDYVRGYCEDDPFYTEVSFQLQRAAALHDCGKPFCKTYVDSKGNPSDTAHYYSHEKVSSYNSLFFDTDSKNNYLALEIAALIRWHMQMHYIDKDPHIETKYKKLLGESFYIVLDVLHRGDLNAH